MPSTTLERLQYVKDNGSTPFSASFFTREELALIDKAVRRRTSKLLNRNGGGRNGPMGMPVLRKLARRYNNRCWTMRYDVFEYDAAHRERQTTGSLKTLTDGRRRVVNAFVDLRVTEILMARLGPLEPTGHGDDPPPPTSALCEPSAPPLTTQPPPTQLLPRADGPTPVPRTRKKRNGLAAADSGLHTASTNTSRLVNTTSSDPSTTAYDCPAYLDEAFFNKQERKLLAQRLAACRSALSQKSSQAKADPRFRLLKSVRKIDKLFVKLRTAESSPAEGRANAILSVRDGLVTQYATYLALKRVVALGGGGVNRPAPAASSVICTSAAAGQNHPLCITEGGIGDNSLLESNNSASANCADAQWSGGDAPLQLTDDCPRCLVDRSFFNQRERELLALKIAEFRVTLARETENGEEDQRARIRRYVTELNKCWGRLQVAERSFPPSPSLVAEDIRNHLLVKYASYQAQLAIHSLSYPPTKEVGYVDAMQLDGVGSPKSAEEKLAVINDFPLTWKERAFVNDSIAGRLLVASGAKVPIEASNSNHDHCSPKDARGYDYDPIEFSRPEMQEILNSRIRQGIRKAYRLIEMIEGHQATIEKCQATVDDATLSLEGHSIDDATRHRIRKQLAEASGRISYCRNNFIEIIATLHLHEILISASVEGKSQGQLRQIKYAILNPKKEFTTNAAFNNSRSRDGTKMLARQLKPPAQLPKNHDDRRHQNQRSLGTLMERREQLAAAFADLHARARSIGRLEPSAHPLPSADAGGPAAVPHQHATGRDPSPAPSNASTWTSSDGDVHSEF